MAFENNLVMLATLEPEYTENSLENRSTGILCFGTNIWSAATSKLEFIQAGLHYLDTFKMRAEAEMTSLRALELDNVVLRSEIQDLIANVQKVDRDEYTRLLSVEWDKNAG